MTAPILEVGDLSVSITDALGKRIEIAQMDIALWERQLDPMFAKSRQHAQHHLASNIGGSVPRIANPEPQLELDPEDCKSIKVKRLYNL